MELVGSLLRFSLYPCFETMKRSDNEGEGGWVEDATNKKKKIVYLFGGQYPGHC